MEAEEALELRRRRLELLEAALVEARDDAERRRLRDELLELHRRLDISSGLAVSVPIMPPRAPGVVEAPTGSPVVGSNAGLPDSAMESAVGADEPEQPLTFLDAVAMCLLEKPLDLSGRASLREYWWFAAFVALTNVFVVFVLYPAAESSEIDQSVSFLVQLAGVGLFLWIMIAHVAGAIRRLHDPGRPGYVFLLALIPLVGPIILLVYLAEQGEPEENEYG